jgi:hypothetical protein
MDYLFEQEMEPAAAIKKLRALRRVSFYLHVDVSMPTTEGRHYPVSESMQVSFAQLESILDKLQRFRELKRQRSPETPEADLPKVSVRITERCCFVG